MAGAPGRRLARAASQQARQAVILREAKRSRRAQLDERSAGDAATGEAQRPSSCAQGAVR